MFVLSSSGGFYNGRNGDNWLSAEKAEAFTFGTRQLADRTAGLLNRYSNLHGATFTVVAA